MKKEKKSKQNKRKFSLIDIILTSIFTLAFLIQIILMFLFYNEMGITSLVYIGYVLWGFSLYFGLISIKVFKKRGDVYRGKSYVNTKKLVKKGPYAIIRHPQYFGGILFTISISLWTQTLISLVLSSIIIILTYQWTYAEDKKLVEKFGDQYKDYKNEVPRLNPILGIIRYYSQKKNK